MSDHWTPSAIPDLGGRTVVVTGANAGLGLEITRILADNGARVLMACRNPAKAEAAAADVLAGAPRGTVEVRSLDLASLASVTALAGQIRAEEPGLHLLVNNAGLMAIDEARTDEGFEMQFGVNHLGHFALTADLMPLLLATPGSRVVNMSSMGHRAGRMRFDDLNAERHPYRRWPAYFQSKLANLLFTFELQRRLGPDAPTQALAAHPGGSRTDLGFEGRSWTNAVMRGPIDRFLQSAYAGALPTVRAGVDPNARGGEYYGPRYLMAGRAVRETPSRRARNGADAHRLWDASEQLTGRTFTVDRPTAP